MSKKNQDARTNAMRMLDAAGISYRTMSYEVDEDDLSGVHVAQEVGMPAGQVFKTLVLVGEKTGHIVCDIPCDAELDLKKVARAAGDKKVEMVHMKELFDLTGYIRGGCSPIGMKKPFPTFIDETAILYDEIAISAGVRGEQIVIGPEVLLDFIGASWADLTKDGNA